MKKGGMGGRGALGGKKVQGEKGDNTPQQMRRQKIHVKEKNCLRPEGRKEEYVLVG